MSAGYVECWGVHACQVEAEAVNVFLSQNPEPLAWSTGSTLFGQHDSGKELLRSLFAADQQNQPFNFQHQPSAQLPALCPPVRRQRRLPGCLKVQHNHQQQDHTGSHTSPQLEDHCWDPQHMRMQMQQLGPGAAGPSCAQPPDSSVHSQQSHFQPQQGSSVLLCKRSRSSSSSGTGTGTISSSPDAVVTAMHLQQLPAAFAMKPESHADIDRLQAGLCSQGRQQQQQQLTDCQQESTQDNQHSTPRQGAAAAELRPPRHPALHTMAPASCPGSTTPAAAVVGQSMEALAAEKAAAQARFAEQQKAAASAAAVSTSPAAHSARVLQHEAAKLQSGGLLRHTLRIVLLCIMLCCLVMVAAESTLLDVVTGISHPGAQAVLLLLLHCLGAWLMMAKLRPLHFADAALEQQYACRSQSGMILADMYVNLASCTGILAAMRGGMNNSRDSHHSSSSSGSHCTPWHSMSGFLPGLESQHRQAAVDLAAGPNSFWLPSFLLLAFAAGSTLCLLLAPKRYRARREHMLLLGRLCMCSLIIMHHHCAVGPLPMIQHQVYKLGAMHMLLATLALHACLMMVSTVRLSAFVSMQLMYVSVLLASSRGSGDNGLSKPVRVLQMLACGMWLPAALLCCLEVNARRAFLADALRRSSKDGFTSKDCSGSHTATSCVRADSSSTLQPCNSAAGGCKHAMV